MCRREKEQKDWPQEEQQDTQDNYNYVVVGVVVSSDGWMEV